MTLAAARWVDLTQTRGPRGAKGRRGRQAAAGALVASGHLVLLTYIGHPAKSSPPKAAEDAPSLMVSLMPALAKANLPAWSPPAPIASPPNRAPGPALVQFAQAEPPLLLLRHDQLAPLDLTSEPRPLSEPPQPAPPMPPASVAVTQVQGEACDFTGALQATLQGSPSVLNELSHIPRQARSVANAIMLWDGRWAALETPGYPAMTDPLHQAILALVRSLPPACQDQPVAGPRLLTILEPEGTTVIVLGSGAWRWGDLLETEGA